MAKKKRGGLLLPILGMLIGVVILAYPVVTDWMTSRENNAIMQEMAETYEPYPQSDPLIQEQEDQARAYNARLAHISDHGFSDELWDYEDQLTFKGSPYMSYIEIPRINVSMPIYHGTSDDVLASGAGHLEHTSLPVGGEWTHTVISAHSGMMGSRAFDDIRHLEVGDLFQLTTLGMKLVYEVDDIETVLPDELDSLTIQDSGDRCTLVTCTPYGVNDHRLLVHAHRSDKELDKTPPVLNMESYVNRRTGPFLIGIAALLIGIIVALLTNRRREKQAREAAMRADGKVTLRLARNSSEYVAVAKTRLRKKYGRDGVASKK